MVLYINNFFQPHLHECSKTPIGCRTWKDSDRVWIAKGSGCRWRNLSSKVCLHGSMTTIERTHITTGRIRWNKVRLLHKFSNSSAIQLRPRCLEFLPVALKRTHTSVPSLKKRICTSKCSSTKQLVRNCNVDRTTAGQEFNFLELVQQWKAKLNWNDTNGGELLAFTSYAIAFPNTFLALVDTYDTLKSGVPNFLIVGLALHELGYK